MVLRFFNIGQSPDLDDNARFVMRYSTIDGAWVDAWLYLFMGWSSF